MQGQSAVSLWSHFKDNSLGQGWVDGRWTGMWVDMRWGRIHGSLFSSLKKRKGDFLLQGVCAVLYISFSEAETVLWGLRLLGTALMWFGVPITVCMCSCVCVIYRIWMTEGFSAVIKAKTLEKSIRTTSISSISFTTKMFLRLDGKPDESFSTRVTHVCWKELTVIMKPLHRMVETQARQKKSCRSDSCRPVWEDSCGVFMKSGWESNSVVCGVIEEGKDTERVKIWLACLKAAVWTIPLRWKGCTKERALAVLSNNLNHIKRCSCGNNNQ